MNENQIDKEDYNGWHVDCGTSLVYSRPPCVYFETARVPELVASSHVPMGTNYN